MPRQRCLLQSMVLGILPAAPLLLLLARCAALTSLQVRSSANQHSSLAPETALSEPGEQVPYLHTAGVSELYQSRGYKVCPHVHSHLGWLHLHRQVHCIQLSTLSCANCLAPATACSHLATYLHATACAQVHCHKLFENLLSNMDTETPLGPVPKAVPEELREDFLLGGLVNLTLLYFDQRHRGETVPYNWTAAVIGTHCGLVLDKHRCHQCRNALPVR